MNRVLRRVLGPPLLGALLVSPAGAGVSVSGYAGSTETFQTRVDLTLPGGTDLAFRPVSWSGESFRSPIYYGLRVLVWPGGGRDAGWGFGLDFIHCKMFADLEDTVAVEGRRAGAGVAGEEPLGDTFAGLSFSHGHNLLLAVAVHRWVWAASVDAFLHRLHPYGGVGAGLAIPHVEVALAGGSTTEEYQIAGPALEALAGLDFVVAPPAAVFLEGKLAYASLDADLEGGGGLQTRPWTVQVAFGVTVGFPAGS